MKNAKRFISLLLAAVILTVLVSCNLNNGIADDSTTGSGSFTTVPAGLTFLTQQSNAKRLSAEEIKGENIKSAADFSVKLLNACAKANSNEFISPLSVMLALAMTANGANTETLAAMESTLGLSVSDLNRFLNSFVQSLNNTENASLISANSVWISNDNGFTVRDYFVDVVKSYYGAEIVTAPFSSPKTLTALNNWVKENTKGRIESILDELDRDAVMVLLNALTFDAEWETILLSHDVNGSFSNSDGTRSEVKYMYGEANKYIHGEGWTGFIKNYKDGNYSYVALLPTLGSDINGLAATITGEEFVALFNKAESVPINIVMPKYSLDYEITLNDALKAMGMGVAFDPELADFSLLGKLDNPDENVYISQVVHKTHLEVDESGTRAAAVTAVVMEKVTGAIESKSVVLNRPFIYAIVDNATGIPVFMGIANHMN